MKRHVKISLAALLFGAAGAYGQLLPSYNSTTPTGSGDYLYSYNAEIDAGTTVNNGSFFTLYDLYGLEVAATPPTGWTVNENGTGATPSNFGAVPDNPSVPNLTWVYIGPSITATSNMTITGFDFTSTQNVNSDQGYYSYSALETDNGDSLTGASTISTPLAPEPAALGVVAMAFLGCRRRREAQ